MSRSKSDALDELRYEIGRLGDQLTCATRLIEEVNKLISNSEYVYSTSSVYACQQDGFYLLTHAGEHDVPQKIPFANNYPTLCAVRGEQQIFDTQDQTHIYIPCYRGHHLLGVLVVYTLNSYDIDQDDLDFLTEAVGFVKNRLMTLGKI